MKAIAMVAHPDDCVIFGMGFINRYRHWDWSICYLTYKNTDPRGREITRFWQSRGVTTKFLQYQDNPQDLELNQLNFDLASAERDIAQAITNRDLVLTHNHMGEYGHPHHKFVHSAVTARHKRVVYFSIGQGNVSYSVPPDAYSLTELPLHKDAVEQHHSTGHRNYYFLSDYVSCMRWL